MTRVLDSLLSLTKMALMIVKIIPVQQRFNYKYFIKKILLYSIAFLFLISTYVFGCIALYAFLVPYWGASLAALSLCLLSFMISCSLVIAVKILKSKKTKPMPPPPLSLEKNLDQLLNPQELTKVLMQASPKILISVLGVIAVASFAFFYRKKDK